MEEGLWTSWSRALKWETIHIEGDETDTVRPCAPLQVFRVVSVCLGCPPETICWEYRDKDKNFHRLGPLTPQEFYREHVKPLYNIEDKVRYPLHAHETGSAPRRSSNLLHAIPKILLFHQVCLVNDPRPQNPYGKLYTVEFLGNMVGARCTLYNNQPIQLLKNVAAESIKKGEVGGWREQGRVARLPVCWKGFLFPSQAVWFGCDVEKHFHGKLGINDMNVWVRVTGTRPPTARRRPPSTARPVCVWQVQSRARVWDFGEESDQSGAPDILRLPDDPCHDPHRRHWQGNADTAAPSNS